MTRGQCLDFAETLFLIYEIGTVVPVAGAGRASLSGSWGAGDPGTQEGLVHTGRQAPLLVLWVQPVRRGSSGPAARRSASVSSGTRCPATGGMAAAPARRASGASGVRTVSAGVVGSRGGPQAG